MRTRSGKELQALAVAKRPRNPPPDTSVHGNAPPDEVATEHTSYNKGASPAPPNEVTASDAAVALLGIDVPNIPSICDTGSASPTGPVLSRSNTTLPPHLLTLIIQPLVKERDWKTLSNLSLTCEAYHNTVLEARYHHVVVDSDAEFEAILKHLSGLPDPYPGRPREEDTPLTIEEIVAEIKHERFGLTKILTIDYLPSNKSLRILRDKLYHGIQVFENLDELRITSNFMQALHDMHDPSNHFFEIKKAETWLSLVHHLGQLGMPERLIIDLRKRKGPDDPQVLGYWRSRRNEWEECPCAHNLVYKLVDTYDKHSRERPPIVGFSIFSNKPYTRPVEPPRSPESEPHIDILLTLDTLVNHFTITAADVPVINNILVDFPHNVGRSATTSPATPDFTKSVAKFLGTRLGLYKHHTEPHFEVSVRGLDQESIDKFKLECKAELEALLSEAKNWKMFTGVEEQGKAVSDLVATLRACTEDEVDKMQVLMLPEEEHESAHVRPAGQSE